jgi:hypothetical protein
MTAGPLDRFDDPKPNTHATVRERRTSNPLARCTCGHPRGAHEHYRRGCNCGLCPCPRYRRWPELAAELRALLRVGVGLVLDELLRR